MQIENYLNKEYSLLTIISTGNKKHSVIANCRCGTLNEYYIYNILSGHTKSCGCLAKAILKTRHTTHGKSHHPIYKRWVDIKKRCYNIKCIQYKNYGGRGISMCDEWRDNFMEFYEWCIKNGFKAELELDRINNDGNYESSNCRFVTKIVNINNRRCSTVIIFNNQRKMLPEWAREYNISPLALRTRLHNNWEIIDALTFPIGKKGGCYNRYSLIKSTQQPQMQ